MADEKTVSKKKSCFGLENYEDLHCPILGTEEPLENPVITPDGQTYEQKAIITWLEKKSTNPLTQTKLLITQLVPNHALKNAIEELKLENSYARCAEKTKQAVENLEPILNKAKLYIQYLKGEAKGTSYIPLKPLWPLGLFCPLNLTLFNDPVITPDGISYEKDAIETWLTIYNSDPLTHKSLSNQQLISNRALKDSITKFKKNRTEQLSEKEQTTFTQNLTKLKELNKNILHANVEIAYLQQKQQWSRQKYIVVTTVGMVAAAVGIGYYLVAACDKPSETDSASAVDPSSKALIASTQPLVLDPTIACVVLRESTKYLSDISKNINRDFIPSSAKLQSIVKSSVEEIKHTFDNAKYYWLKYSSRNPKEQMQGLLRWYQDKSEKPLMSSYDIINHYKTDIDFIRSFFHLSLQPGNEEYKATLEKFILDMTTYESRVSLYYLEFWLNKIKDMINITSPILYKTIHLQQNIKKPDVGITPITTQYFMTIDKINNINLAIKLLLEKGAITARNTQGQTALHQAIIALKPSDSSTSDTSLSEIRFLLDQHNIEINAIDHNQMTPLDLAIQQKCNDAVKILIEKGANIFKNNFLLKPIVDNNLSMVRLLIDAYLDADETTKYKKGEYLTEAWDIVMKLEKPNFELLGIVTVALLEFGTIKTHVIEGLPDDFLKIRPDIVACIRRYSLQYKTELACPYKPRIPKATFFKESNRQKFLSEIKRTPDSMPNTEKSKDEEKFLPTK